MKKQLLLLVMLLLPMMASSYEVYKYEGETTYKYDATSSTATLCAITSNINTQVSVPACFTWMDDEGEEHTVSVTNIGKDVSLSSNIRQLILPYTVTAMSEYAFRNSKLETINIPYQLAAIPTGAFYGCKQLKTILWDEDEDEHSAVSSIDSQAFYGCTSLTGFYVPYSLTSIASNAFIDCTSLASFSVSEYNTTFEVGSYGELCMRGNPTLVKFPPASIQLEVNCCYTVLGDYAFQGCQNLKTVTLSKQTLGIGIECFWGCSSLLTVVSEMEVPVTIDYSAFSRRMDITLKVPFGCKTAYEAADYWNEFKTIEEMPGVDGGMFTGETMEGVTLTFKIISSAQNTCQVGNGIWGDTGHNIISPQYNSVTSLTIPATIKGYHVVAVGNYAFYNCRILQNIVIEDGIKDIKDSAFELCKRLVSLRLPNTLETVGNRAFFECPLNEMTTIILPEGMKTLGEDAFNDFCEDNPLVATKRSVSITLPSTLESIGRCAFMTEGHITEINVNMTVPMEIPDGVFGYIRYTDNEYNDEIFYDKANLYVPKGTKDLYANTAGWSRFVNILVKGEQICATPVINYKQGMLQFECATDGVVYHYEFTTPGNRSDTGNSIVLPTTYIVKVYASKEGYTDSDVATANINVAGQRGDADGNGVVDIADAVHIVNLVIGKVDALAPQTETNPQTPQ